MEFLITDAVTLNKTWISADSARAACIARENELRSDPDAHWTRKGLPLLPANSKASHNGNGEIISVSVGDSFCRGHRENVTRL